MYWNLYQKQTKEGRQTSVQSAVSLKVLTPCWVVRSRGLASPGNPGSHLWSSHNYSQCPLFLPNCSGLGTYLHGHTRDLRCGERGGKSGTIWMLTPEWRGVCGSPQPERGERASSSSTQRDRNQTSCQQTQPTGCLRESKLAICDLIVSLTALALPEGGTEILPS